MTFLKPGGNNFIFKRPFKPPFKLTGLVVSLCLAGCSGLATQDRAPSGSGVDIHAIPDAVPRAEPRSKYGNKPSYQVNGATYQVLPSAAGYTERGIASWYGTQFHGRRTSSSETYDMYAMTAAHRSLPLPTYVRVTNLKNRRSVVVKINDRGPFHDNRLIDLSYAAAVKLDIIAVGTGLVEVQAVNGPVTDPPEVQFTQAPASSDPVRLYLQLGAYAKPENAQRMASQLKEQGFQPQVTQSKQGGDMLLHRVRLGPLPSAESADDLMRKLRHLGYAQYRVIVD